MGLLTAAGWAPHLVLSLFAGAWVDRRPHRRPILVATDLLRAAAIATIPLVAVFDAVTMPHLYATAFAVGALTVFFDLSYGTLLPSVVTREEIVEAQGKFSVSRSVSYIGGPSVAGVLVQVLTAPFALLADAASFVLSAALISRVRADEPELEPSDEPVWARLRAGVGFLLGHPVLRAGVGCTSTINFFNMMFFALFVLYMAEELGLSPATIGIVLGVGAGGALVGALAAPRVGRTIGIGPAIILGAVIFPAPLLLVPAASGPEPLVIGLLIAAELLASFGVMIFDVNQNSLNLLVTPHRLRARTYGAARVFNYGTRPLGALAGGALGSLLGIRPTLWIATAGALLGVIWLWFSPLRTIREPPAETA